jgi:hypothetical protein
MPVVHNNSQVGVVGIDIPINDLFSEAIFQHNYIFVIDKKGRTLIHPLLPLPDDTISLYIPSINILEPGYELSSVISAMKE